MSNEIKMYLIASTDAKYMYWSNDIGWTDDVEQAEYFTAEEKASVRVPIDGKWEVVK